MLPVRAESCVRPRRFVHMWAAFLLALACGDSTARSQEADGAKPADASAAADKNAAIEDEKKEAADAPAPEPDLNDGRLIRVRLPLTGNADTHIRSSIQRAVAQLTRAPRHKDPAGGAPRRPVLIFELVPKGGAGGFGEGTDFTRAFSLADYLIGPELASVKTVAYIPRTIKGHGVLVALACEEIAMHPDAEIGEAGIDEDASRPIKSSIVKMYEQIAAARSAVPKAIAVGMLDRRAEVLKVETEHAIEFILSDELEALKKNHTLTSPPEIIIPAGSLGNFKGREGKEYAFVRLLASDRAALARGLNVAPEAVVEDQSLVGDWRPVIVAVEGPITLRKVRQLDTLIDAEVRDRDVNWLGVKIDSSGGELEYCLQLADRLAGLDPNEVQTVAYIPVDASGGAALVAMACDQVVMQPEAHLGGKGTLDLDRQMLDAANASIGASLAKDTQHNASLLLALIDPDIELFRYSNNKTGEVRYFSPEEADALPDQKDWQKGPKVKPAGEPLRLASNQAEEFGLATHVVDSFDEFKQLYGFERDPRLAEPNWALELIEALSSPALAVLLLVIGFVGIYIELHTPGVGAGAFVAALAFLLFFWSNFLHGTAGWLEFLLFVCGLFFLVLELLVLPGFGVFGLGGGAMILASLVLASQTFVLPTKASELVELRRSLTIVAAAMLCVIVASITLRRYLPRAPVFRTLLLNPTSEEELIDLDYRESLADFSHLIGQQGTATTNLMPAGKAEFDGQLIDVIAEGLPIDRGQPVVVTKARGNRVLVRAVDADIGGRR